MQEIDKSKEAAIDSCPHKFCFECIVEWSKVANICPMCKKSFHKVTTCNTSIKKGKNGKCRKCVKELKIKNKRQSNHFDIADFLGDSESEGEQYNPRLTRSRRRGTQAPTRPAPSSRSTQGNEVYVRNEWLEYSDECEWVDEDECNAPARQGRTEPSTESQLQTRPQFQSVASTLQAYPSQYRQRRGRAQLGALAEGSGQGCRNEVIEIDLDTASPARSRTRGMLPPHHSPVVATTSTGSITQESSQRRRRSSVASEASDISVILLSPLTDRNSRRSSAASSYHNTSYSSSRDSWGYNFELIEVDGEEEQDQRLPLEAFRCHPMKTTSQTSKSASSNDPATFWNTDSSQSQYSEWFSARREGVTDYSSNSSSASF